MKSKSKAEPETTVAAYVEGTVETLDMKGYLLTWLTLFRPYSKVPVVLLWALLAWPLAGYGQMSSYVCYAPPLFFDYERMPLTFDKLHGGTDCHCLDEFCKENTEDTFARALLTDAVDEPAFRTLLERDGPNCEKQVRRVPDEEASEELYCDEVCKRFRSVSINLWSDETCESIISRYTRQTTGKIKKKRRFYYYVLFKMTEGCCGKVKHSNDPKDLSHFDFFKCDGFEVGNLIQQGVYPLRAEV